VTSNRRVSVMHTFRVIFIVFYVLIIIIVIIIIIITQQQIRHYNP